MEQKDFKYRITSCTYAYQSYQHLVNTIKFMLRSGDYNEDQLHITMKNLDDFITDNSPIINKFLKKHDKIYIND